MPPPRTNNLVAAAEAPTAERVVTGGALRLGGYAAGLGASVLSSALVLRHLGVVDTGRLVTILSLVVIAAGLGDLGLNNVALREYSVRQGIDRSRLMANLLGLRGLLTIVSVIGAAIFAVIADYPAAMLAGVAIAGTGVVLGALQQTLVVPFASALRNSWVTVATLIFSVGSSAVSVLLVVLGSGLVPFYAATTVAMVPSLALTAALVRGLTPLTPRISVAECRNIGKRILPYAVASVLYVIYFRCAVVAVSLLSGPHETGYYSAAFRVLEAFTFIPPLLASTAFPVLAREAQNGGDAFVRSMNSLLEGMLLVGVWLALSLGLGAGFAIAVVAGDHFDPSVTVLQLQAVALLGTCLIAAWGYGLLSLGAHRSVLWGNLAGLVVGAVVGLILIPSHGALGGAIALACAECTVALGYGVSLLVADRRLLNGMRIVPKVALAALVAVGVPVLLGVAPLVAAIVGSVLYFALLVVLRAFPPELRASTGALWTRLRRA
jgi:O-antigen/teichoic acid export membrane protein